VPKKGEPQLWDEIKRRVCVTLTPAGASGLTAIAESMGLSRSELLERLGRGVLAISLGEERNAGEANKD